ncbi:hypothetical protein [Rhizobium sp. ZX09]|uniref:hypothetical protein n=1 Tax=Rhizobium sp. ZX09 TaxID=2291939 RepID=UPI001A993F5C|nr:hypothetical protein [Rhizobium sp. ZX09]QSZ59137.1 hypothetical protein BTN45_18075 [Rhizobium sp. ZX09]
MQIFLVLAETDRADFDEKIRREFGDNSKRITSGQWLVAANDTPQGVSTRLGIGNGAFGRVMIAIVTQYWGWHDKEIWSWIGLKGAA